MIKKLFTYSDEVAKKSGSNSVVLKVILLISLVITVYMIFPIIGVILGVVALIFAIPYSVNNSIGFDETLRSYAIDEDGKIYEINLLHEFYNAGATGQLVAGSVGTIVGSIKDIKALNEIENKIDIINNPEIVSKLIESRPSQVINIIEILKVYSIEEHKTNFKVNCDMKVITDDNRMYNKTNLRIKKCYTDYEILIEELNKKRV